MQLTLHYAPVACSLVPYIGLQEANASFSVELVDLRAGAQHSEVFQRLNPKRKVPVLVIDGEPLTENVAIQIWIARHFPAAKLLPTSNALAEYRAIAHLTWCASSLHTSITPNFYPQRYCDAPDTAEAVRRSARAMLIQHLRVAEASLQEREWFFEHFTFCDIYFFWCCRRIRQIPMTLAEFPACEAHFKRVAARPSVRAYREFEARAMSNLGIEA